MMAPPPPARWGLVGEELTAFHLLRPNARDINGSEGYLAGYVYINKEYSGVIHAEKQYKVFAAINVLFLPFSTLSTSHRDRFLCFAFLFFLKPRTPMHQLRSGLYVSGPPPEPAKEKSPSPVPAPYTGGDVCKSGELGRMFEIPPSSSPRSHASRSHAGHLHRPSPLSQLRHSGLLVGPVQESARKEKSATMIEEDAKFAFGLPLYCYLVVVVVVGAGIGVGVFVVVVLQQIVVLMIAALVMGVVIVIGVWNWWRKEREVERFFRCYPDTCVDRSNLPVGELVKIRGQVTCGHLPLRTSYQDFSRCIFTSSELYEYRRWSDLPANPNHRRFTWGLRYSERRVANFYISDRSSGIRFLVRAGDGTKVTSFVKSRTIEISKEKRELSPNFLTWLVNHNLPIDDRIVRLKEGFIKEGDTASVIGILKRHQLDNMIDPPSGLVTTGCQWKRCLFPVLVEGLILIGHENPDEIVYIV